MARGGYRIFDADTHIIEPVEPIEGYLSARDHARLDALGPLVQRAPAKAGMFTGLVTVLSNDPNAPTQTIKLKGSAKGPDAPPPPPDEETGEPVAKMKEEGACACRLPGDGRDARSSGAGAFALAAAAALIARRRRRD